MSYYRTQSGNKVDFVAETARGYKKCFQVASEHDDPKTFEREQRALNEDMADDSYLENGIAL